MSSNNTHMKRFILLLSAALLVATAVFSLSKREYNMVQCGYVSQGEAEIGAGYASEAAWYLGATSVSTHSYNAGPTCYGCPTQYCFQIHWTVPDPELNDPVAAGIIKEAIGKAAKIMDEKARVKYLDGIKKELQGRQ